MSLKILSRHLHHNSAKRLYATRAATATKPQPTKEEPKLTTLQNGVIVATVENFTPLTRIAVIFKAGSRYETVNNLGVTHALRYCAGLGTKDASVFGITRNIQQIGATLSATSTREHFIYSLDCMRDELDTGLEFMGKVATEQVFKPWEVSDFQSRLNVEIAMMKTQPEIILMEKLHKAAFHSSLQNSLYTPKYMIGSHDSEMLTQYVKDHFTSSRMALVGVGIPHEVLTEYAELFEAEAGPGPSEVATKYGGGEVRLDLGLPYSYVAVAAEGVSLQNPKEVLSAAVLQHVMGMGSFLKRGNPQSKLGQAAFKATKNPFAVSSLNINYSDSGLIGFYLVGQPEDMENLVKAVVGQFFSTAKSGVTDKEFQVAKKRVKAALNMSLESNSGQLEDMSLQAIVLGKLITDDEMNQMLENVTLGDVNNVAKKIVGGKASMAAIGNLSRTPRLDRLR